MEPSTTAATLNHFRQINWDTPYRILASVLALTIIFVRSTTPLTTLSGLAENLDMGPLASWFASGDVWAHQHLLGSSTQAAVGFGSLLCLLLAFRGSSVMADNRAAASFWVFAGMATYDPGAFWSYWFLYLLAVIVAACLVFTKADYPLVEWLILTPVSIAVAAFWFPIALVSWVLARTQSAHTAAV